ncbi:acylphosphatase [Candidatus Roizmanbacteria bacterium]|nr:acylphosphatase [Candidatus Roizmanbacteria bacterium]
MKRIHLFISGRVQGVFFRAHCKEKADELGLRGWVTNLPDGRVEAVFEGEENHIAKMVHWCYSGSLGSRVEKIDIQEEKVRGEEGFEIRQ